MLNNVPEFTVHMAEPSIVPHSGDGVTPRYAGT